MSGMGVTEASIPMPSLGLESPLAVAPVTSGTYKILYIQVVCP